MNRQEIEKLDVGRELDALIAEKIFGKKVWFKKGNPTAWKNGEAVAWFPNDYVTEPDGTIYLHMTDGYDGMIKKYSQHIGAAWDIVEEFRRGWKDHVAACVELAIYDSLEPEDCECSIWGLTIKAEGVSFTAREMPLAICKAALWVAENE